MIIYIFISLILNVVLTCRLREFIIELTVENAIILFWLILNWGDLGGVPGKTPKGGEGGQNGHFLTFWARFWIEILHIFPRISRGSHRSDTPPPYLQIRH
jgi:hypothetical protein